MNQKILIGGGVLILAAAVWYFFIRKSSTPPPPPAPDELERQALALDYTLEGENQPGPIPEWQGQRHGDGDDQKKNIPKSDFNRRVRAQVLSILRNPEWMKEAKETQSQEWRTTGGMPLAQVVYQQAREWVSSIYYYTA